MGEGQALGGPEDTLGMGQDGQTAFPGQPSFLEGDYPEDMDDGDFYGDLNPPGGAGDPRG